MEKNNEKPYKNFFLSLHGSDIGKAYCLPRNVRVIMECSPGSVTFVPSSYDKEQLKHLFNTNNSNDMSLIEMMKSHSIKKSKQHFKQDFKNKQNEFCMFSGNTNKNIIPDLILSNDIHKNFINGLFPLPLIADIVSTPNDKIKESNINQQIIKELDTDIDVENPNIDKYLLPQLISQFKNFSNEYKYLSDFKIKIRKECSIQDLITISRKQDSLSVSRQQSNNANLTPGMVFDDLPTHLLKNEKSNYDKIISQNVPLNGGRFLSNIITYLCNKYEDKIITIFARTCRSFSGTMIKECPNITIHLLRQLKSGMPMTIDNDVIKYSSIIPNKTNEYSIYNESNKLYDHIIYDDDILGKQLTYINNNLNKDFKKFIDIYNIDNIKSITSYHYILYKHLDTVDLIKSKTSHIKQFNFIPISNNFYYVENEYLSKLQKNAMYKILHNFKQEGKWIVKTFNEIKHTTTDYYRWDKKREYKKSELFDINTMITYYKNEISVYSDYLLKHSTINTNKMERCDNCLEKADMFHMIDTDDPKHDDFNSPCSINKIKFSVSKITKSKASLKEIITKKHNVQNITKELNNRTKDLLFFNLMFLYNIIVMYLDFVYKKYIYNSLHNISQNIDYMKNLSSIIDYRHNYYDFKNIFDLILLKNEQNSTSKLEIIEESLLYYKIKMIPNSNIQFINEYSMTFSKIMDDFKDIINNNMVDPNTTFTTINVPDIENIIMSLVRKSNCEYRSEIEHKNNVSGHNIIYIYNFMNYFKDLTYRQYNNIDIYHKKLQYYNVSNTDGSKLYYETINSMKHNYLLQHNNKIYYEINTIIQKNINADIYYEEINNIETIRRYQTTDKGTNIRYDVIDGTDQYVELTKIIRYYDIINSKKTYYNIIGDIKQYYKLTIDGNEESINIDEPLPEHIPDGDIFPPLVIQPDNTEQIISDEIMKEMNSFNETLPEISQILETHEPSFCKKHNIHYNGTCLLCDNDYEVSRHNFNDDDDYDDRYEICTKHNIHIRFHYLSKCEYCENHVDCIVPCNKSCPKFKHWSEDDRQDFFYDEDSYFEQDEIELKLKRPRKLKKQDVKKKEKEYTKQPEVFSKFLKYLKYKMKYINLKKKLQNKDLY